MLTVLTWLWAQPESRTNYAAWHVNTWADMVRRHLSLPHRIACVTDMPEGIDAGVEIIAPPRDFEAVRLPTWRSARPQCLRRLALFRRDAAELFGGERIVSMDLDCAIGGELAPLFEGGEEFRIARGTAAGRPYNGSMMMLRAGARARVFEEFTAERAAEAGRRFVGSDQAWIALCLGAGEATWSAEDGVAFHGVLESMPSPPAPSPAEGRGGSRDGPRIVFYPGSVKPWDARDAWTRRHYRKVVPGRCLVLGYGPSLWDDVDRALDGPPVDAVIASPEAAAHWRGEILAVAPTNAEAARLAFMHGYDDVTWCGARAEAWE